MAAICALALSGVVASGVGHAERMVKYAHPVWHNGHRVLYHGVWRGGGHVARKDAEEDSAPARSSYASLHEFIVLVDTDDATALRMATELVNAARAAGLKSRAWAGKTSPAALADFVAKDGGDFVVAAIDAIAADPAQADLRAKAPFVTRLAAEPVVVVAREGVTDLAALDARPVSFGEADGAVDATAKNLFAKFGVAPQVVHSSVGDSLTALQAGKIDALVMLGADESRAVADAARAGKLHALALPWREELARFYAPAKLTGKDLPGLVADDATLETVGAPFGLLAVDAGEDSPRAAQDAPFVAALFERFQPLLGLGADPKWREVNLAAETDWPRLPAARDWIERHRAVRDPVVNSFLETAKAARNSQATAPAIADKLYGGLLRSGAQP